MEETRSCIQGRAKCKAIIRLTSIREAMALPRVKAMDLVLEQKCSLPLMSGIMLAAKMVKNSNQS